MEAVYVIIQMYVLIKTAKTWELHQQNMTAHFLGLVSYFDKSISLDIFSRKNNGL